MTGKTVFWGSIIAALAVAFGAFGSHVLKGRLEPNAIATFQTAVQYQMYHALALVCLGIYNRMKPNKRIDNAIFAMYLGIGLFSGSLYVMTLSHFIRLDLKWLGAITPLGGISFIIGWLQLAWATQLSSKK
ncbi:MAG TPA: DUF423 domain-containing protein [Phnomibacter sp.]|nr:DUF423 domain-containing protein [Phnomibacter sp.]